MQDPIQQLYNIVKPLANEIEIYKEVMTEDDDSTPDSYLLLKSDMTNTGRVYGDGRVILRASDCDIVLVSKGTADVSTDLHNVNKKKVMQLLDSEEIDYIGVNLGYDDSIKSTQYAWTVTVIYGQG